MRFVGGRTHGILIALVMFGVGLGLIVFFAEQLVKGVVGTSLGFGLSTFLLSVIFVGFDPDNLAVGAVASAEGVSGIAEKKSRKSS